MKKAYVLLANGFELVEAMTPVDVLTRAGVEVELVSIGEDLKVVSAQNVAVLANKVLTDVNTDDGDVLILPGGYPGYENLKKDPKTIEVIKSYVKADKLIGAICGAPTILAEHKILEGKKLTAHSSTANDMKNYMYIGTNVCQDRKSTRLNSSH